ncbi:hypothetical protein TruAng_003329 [Truncatella angustata]|nr:hypothetical protein TruAng_003329 [Truncatella angustata]
MESRRRQEAIKTGRPDNEIARFGTVEEIFSRNYCTSCQALQREMQRWERDYEWSRSGDIILHVIATDPPDLGGGASLHSQPLYVMANRQALQQQSQEDREHIIMNLFFTEQAAPMDLRGRFFDTDKIDMEMIKGWIQCCETTHGERCTSNLMHHTEYTSALDRMLLVDIEQRCIVYGSLENRYIALSYVWGNVTTIRTTFANLDRMMTPGSINYDAPTSDSEMPLPETLRDLMRLARVLSVRYVWVDALCIVQDAPDMIDHLNGMATIYASAFLTVISEGTDANFGLPGIGLGARSRKRACRPLELPGMTVLLNDNMIPPNKPRIWEKRGWTFQEGLFCGRALIFEYGGTVSWKCGREFWDETYAMASESLDWVYDDPKDGAPDWRYFGLASLNFNWPDMRRWCEMAEEYYVRELTYDYDALNALAGTLSVVNKTSPGGFIWGLPAYFFDIFLLWDVTCGEEDNLSQRRDPTAGIPTWSFLGWKGGELDTLWWRFSMDHTFIEDLVRGFGHDVIVTPTVKKWYLEDQATENFIPIDNHFHTARSQPSEYICSEWRTHESDWGTSYSHPSLGEGTQFRYPVPCLQTINSDIPIKHGHSRNLRFETRMGSFSIGDVIVKGDGQSGDVNATHATLLNMDDTWAGAIRLSPSHMKGSKQTHPRQRIDLIEVAAGQVQEDAWPKILQSHGYSYHIPEWDCEDRPKATKLYEFYFVFWVECEDGVAYRKALGRVEKQAWLRVAQEHVHVTLG